MTFSNDNFLYLVIFSTVGALHSTSPINHSYTNPNVIQPLSDNFLLPLPQLGIALFNLTTSSPTPPFIPGVSMSDIKEVITDLSSGSHIKKQSPQQPQGVKSVLGQPTSPQPSTRLSSETELMTSPTPTNDPGKPMLDDDWGEDPSTLPLLVHPLDIIRAKKLKLIDERFLKKW
jgi:hypothetical protein